MEGFVFAKKLVYLQKIYVMKYLNFICLLCVALWAMGCKKSVEPIENNEEDSAFFWETRLYAPGDYGSANWRIPAICTLPDGTLLAVNDKRKFNEGDLPQDIDIVARRSSDNGHTWSEPVTVVEGTGMKHGFGDPALVVTSEGEVLCMYVGGNGLWASTEDDPDCSYVSRSSDGGVTWGKPENITALLWGSNALNPVCRNYKASFFGSGNALRLTRGSHAGRILVAAAMCRKSENVLDNFVVYSDDNGHSWNVSDMAYSGGDEAKLVELVDGRVLISVRQSGARGYNISTDGGVSWGNQGRWSEIRTNACNGDIIRFAAKDMGDKENILLQSVPNSMNRENVSIFASYDEGVSWSWVTSLYAGPSVYSSLTVLKDGTIGAYVEKNPSGQCELWFQNFSFKWLLENKRDI